MGTGGTLYNVNSVNKENQAYYTPDPEKCQHPAEKFRFLPDTEQEKRRARQGQCGGKRRSPRQGAAGKKGKYRPDRRRGEETEGSGQSILWGRQEGQRKRAAPRRKAAKKTEKRQRKKHHGKRGGQRKNGEEQEKGQKSRSAVYKTRSRAPAKPSSARGISTTYGAGLSAKYALPEEYKIPTAEGQTQSAGTCRRKGGRRTSDAYMHKACPAK